MMEMGLAVFYLLCYPMGYIMEIILFPVPSGFLFGAFISFVALSIGLIYEYFSFKLCPNCKY